MRDLKAGDRCEHTEKVGSVHTGYRDERCTTIHLSRVDGKPQQLVLVKEGRKSRFVCLKHAPIVTIAQTKPRQKKRSYQAEQISLL